MVFDAKRDVRPGTVIRESKLSWIAHKNSLLTALSRSMVGSVVFSGASDGTVHMWTFDKRPVDDAPAARFKHHTGMGGVGGREVQASYRYGRGGGKGGSSIIQVWDQ